MDHALVVVDASEGAKKLIKEAGELANGVDAKLSLVHVTTDEEYREKVSAMRRIPEADVTYNLEAAEEGGRQFVRQIAREELDGLDVEYDIVAEVGDVVEEVLEEADQRDCDHIFVAGRKRSPAGKALFGDTAQAIILDFDGAVTILTE